MCDMAAEAGLKVVPHAWKTGISVAVAAHLATVTPHMPFFEFLPAELCESRLRKELTVDEMVFADGRLGIPARPGPRHRAQPRRAGRVRAGCGPCRLRLAPRRSRMRSMPWVCATAASPSCGSSCPARRWWARRSRCSARRPSRVDGERYVGLLAALDAVGRGDVVVVASGPSDAAAVWGELLSNACLARGAVGTVTDGLIRDSAQIAELGYPVFARGTSPLDIHGRLEVVAHGGEVTVAGVPGGHRRHRSSPTATAWWSCPRPTPPRPSNGPPPRPAAKATSAKPSAKAPPPPKPSAASTSSE